MSSQPEPAPAPLWFTRNTRDHRPSLLALPSSLVVIDTGEGRGVHHRDVLWLPLGQRVVAVPARGPVRVHAEGTRGVVVDSDGATTAWREGALTWDPSPARRHGRDLVIRRRGASWVDAPTEGAATSPRAWPWASGRGWVWADAGWLYRRGQGGPTRVAGPIRPHEGLFPGPDGSLLVVDDDRLVGVAAPDAPRVDLEAPLAHDGTARFAPDGRSVIGREPDAATFLRLDTRTGAVIARTDEEVPGTHGAVAAGDGTEAGEALLALPLAWDAGLLAGPAGRAWTLDEGAVPRLLPDLDGPLAPAGTWWAGVIDGAARWFDPRTGRTRRELLPLPDAEPAAAWGADGVAAFAFHDGRVVALTPRGPTTTLPPLPGSAEPAPASWRWLGVDGALPAGRRRLVFGAEGLLLLTPP